MHFLLNERTMLFVDGTHIYSASRNLGFDVDYRKFLEFFRAKTNVIRAQYYCAVVDPGVDDEGKQAYSPLKPLMDWLAYNSYVVVSKPAKEFTDRDGRRRVKGNMDMEIACDMLEMAASNRLDHAVLVAGDGDYRRMVEGVQRHGVRVSVLSSIKSDPPMVADELRRQADQFIELSDVYPQFARADRQSADAGVRAIVGARPALRRTPANPDGEAA